MNELIIIGKTITTFGIKGELKVISYFERCDEAFVVGRKILLNNIEHTITSLRYHKNFILMGIDNLDNINLVLDKVGFNIYMKRSDLNLSDDEYLYVDLIDALVIDDDNTELGIIKSIEQSKANDLLKIKSDKDFYIPLISEYIVKFDKKEKILYTKNAKALKM